MSESCRRGYKCMCFQCGEKDCEKYQPETPVWFKTIIADDKLMERITLAVRRGIDAEKQEPEQKA